MCLVPQQTSPTKFSYSKLLSTFLSYYHGVTSLPIPPPHCPLSSPKRPSFFFDTEPLFSLFSYKIYSNERMRKFVIVSSFRPHEETRTYTFIVSSSLSPLLSVDYSFHFFSIHPLELSRSCPFPPLLVISWVFSLLFYIENIFEVVSLVPSVWIRRGLGFHSFFSSVFLCLLFFPRS